MSDEVATRRWRGVIAIALVAGAIGVLTNQSDLLILAIVGVVFSAYPLLTRQPSIDLTLERHLGNPTPVPGESVEVTVTLTNTGGSILPDCRISDGVPSLLGVIEGTPRRGTTLFPGGSTSFSYWIEVQSGRHTFDPATVIVRDISGAREIKTTVAADTEIDCTSDTSDIVPRNLPLIVSGYIESNLPGSGIDFHQTREAYHGDPVNRIDWKRYARTGTLTTIEFDEHRAAAVMVVVDARPEAYRGLPSHPHAVAICVSAAHNLIYTLHGRRISVGLAGLGRELCWIDPAFGADHLDSVAKQLAVHETFASDPFESNRNDAHQRKTVREQLSGNIQVILLSPLCDDRIVESAMTINADGHPVTVLSPDVTATETPGQQLAAIERANRISALRRNDVVVFEWRPAEVNSVLVSDERGATVWQ